MRQRRGNLNSSDILSCCHCKRVLVMASSLPFCLVNLDESEVPGAVLTDLSIEQHSVVQLKRWLQCRGVITSGKKIELGARVKEHISRGTKITPAIDGGLWHDNKLKTTRQENLENIVSKPPVFPISGWREFPGNKIPKKFSYGSIYEHFIEVKALAPRSSNSTVTSARNGTESSEEDDENEFCGTSKPLKKGRLFFKSGHVKNLKDNKVNNHYCLKGTVQSSYRENVSFNVMVMLGKNGHIVDSTCECAASAMGRCNHVAGVLFALEDYTIMFGNSAVACTSKLCEWNKGRKEKAPTIIASRKYSDRVHPSIKGNFNPVPSNSEPQQNIDSLLYQCQLYGKPTMWELLLEYKYSDYTIDDNRTEQLKINIKKLQESLLFDFKTPSEVVNTRGQADSDRWHQLRRLLITASRCKEYYTVELTNMFNKLNTMMWHPQFIKNKYVEHGIKYENVALEKYSTVTGFKVSKTGLWVNPKYIGLGASPDGLVFDTVTNTYGLLEIKCPYILKDKEPTDFSDLNPQQLNSFCSTIGNDHQLQIKENHKYYYQLQMQMAILEKPWCDFLIWTFKGYNIERVKFDKKFWSTISPKLLEVHQKVIAPEYFEIRVPRKLDPLVLL